jgi:hypothetical protein
MMEKGLEIHLLHVWSNFLLEKLAVAHSVKKYLPFWNHSFSTVFRRITTPMMR